MKKIQTHRDLDVYQIAFEVAMQIFETSKSFPKDERFSLTDQIRRSSRSVCANIAEAFRKRRYPAAFIGRLSIAEAEAAETQVWLDFMLECRYGPEALHAELSTRYDHILGKLVIMIKHPDNWKL